MNSIKLTLSVLIIFFCFNVRAQIDTSRSSDRVNVFNNGTHSPNKGISVDSTEPKNVIMFNPLLFINGDIPVYYQRVVTKFMVVEVAPGITYHDYGANIYQIFNGLQESTGNGITEHLPADSGSKSAIGYSFKIALKFFPGRGNLLDGDYISPEIGFRRYNVNYLNYNVLGEPVPIYTPGYTNVTDFKILFGREEESDNVRNLFGDGYVGVGYRYISGYDYSRGGLAAPNYFTAANKESYWQFTFYIGIKLGFGVR